MAKQTRGGAKYNNSSSSAQSPTIKQATQILNAGLKALMGAQVAGVYNVMTDIDAQTLRDLANDSYLPSVKDAIKQYISNTNYSQGFSKSQTLNYKLEQGLPLNANEKYMHNYLQKGMHVLGQNTKLQRFAHDDILQQMGIADYTKYTEAQLNKMLVGKTFRQKAYGSTSYDVSKNPFSNSASGGGGREIAMNIDADASTQVIFGAKVQSEIITNVGTNYRIKSVKYGTHTATPRTKSKAMKQLIIELEAWGD